MDDQIKEFLTISHTLYKQGYLKKPGDIFVMHGNQLLGLKPHESLKKWNKGSVQIWNMQEQESTNSHLQLFKSIFKSKKKYFLGLFSKSPFTLGYSRTQKHLYPLLDDLAQLVGTRLQFTTYDKILKHSKKKDMLLVKDEGCLCLAKNYYELIAMAMVTEKSCRAEIESFYVGGGKRIRFFEAWIMRFIYFVTYEKKAHKM